MLAARLELSGVQDGHLPRSSLWWHGGHGAPECASGCFPYTQQLQACARSTQCPHAVIPQVLPPVGAPRPGQLHSGPALLHPCWPEAAARGTPQVLRRFHDLVLACHSLTVPDAPDPSAGTCEPLAEPQAAQAPAAQGAPADPDPESLPSPSVLCLPALPRRPRAAAAAAALRAPSSDGLRADAEGAGAGRARGAGASRAAEAAPAAGPTPSAGGGVTSEPAVGRGTVPWPEYDCLHGRAAAGAPGSCAPAGASRQAPIALGEGMGRSGSAGQPRSHFGNDDGEEVSVTGIDTAALAEHTSGSGSAGERSGEKQPVDESECSCSTALAEHARGDGRAGRSESDDSLSESSGPICDASDHEWVEASDSSSAGGSDSDRDALGHELMSMQPSSTASDEAGAASTGAGGPTGDDDLPQFGLIAALSLHLACMASASVAPGCSRVADASDAVWAAALLRGTAALIDLGADAVTRLGSAAARARLARPGAAACAPAAAAASVWPLLWAAAAAGTCAERARGLGLAAVLAADERGFCRWGPLARSAMAMMAAEALRGAALWPMRCSAFPDVDLSGGGRGSRFCGRVFVSPPAAGGPPHAVTTARLFGSALRRAAAGGCWVELIAFPVRQARARPASERVQLRPGNMLGPVTRHSGCVLCPAAAHGHVVAAPGCGHPGGCWAPIHVQAAHVRALLACLHACMRPACALRRVCCSSTFASLTSPCLARQGWHGNECERVQP